MDKYLMTAKDLQEFLGVSRDRAYALMHSSGFPSTKIQGRYYVARNAVEEWVTNNKYKHFILNNSK